MKRFALNVTNGAEFALVALMFLFLGSVAQADPILVGNIKITEYTPYSNAGTGLGGVTIRARYDVNSNFADQDCCDESDIHWIQRVTSSSSTGFTPDPNRPFIDPRTGQDVGGGQVGDGSPFYDFSNHTFVDVPAVLLERGLYSFFAETLLVCIEDMMMGILGGFSWGFTIAADDMTVTALPIMSLVDGSALRDGFNTALASDFPGWSIKAATELWPDERPFFVVSEPDSLLVMSVGLLALLIFVRVSPFRQDLAKSFR